MKKKQKKHDAHTKIIAIRTLFFCLFIFTIYFWENINHKGARQAMEVETNELIKQLHRITALDVLPSLYLCEVNSPGATYLHFLPLMQI